MRLHKSKFNKYTGLLYISPWILGFLLFQLYPFVLSFYYSLTDIKLSSEYNFVGLENYIKIFTKDPNFWNSIKLTVKFTIIAVPAKLVFALLIAMIMNMKLKGINFFRTIYYLPSILGGSVAISVLWRLMFMKDGVVNKAIGYLGIPAVNWLGDPKVALISISLLTVWQFGSPMVLFLAGLKQVPVSLYEAAILDGASKWKQFLHITLPMLSPIILFNVIMQTINALQEFTGAFIVTKGGPVKSTYLYTLMIYDQGFGYSRIGYASALSWILFLVIMVVTIIIFKCSAKLVFYGDEG